MRDIGKKRSPAGGDELFAGYYDDLVHGRHEMSAAAEDLAFLRAAFAARVARPVVDILDAGCGTGRYLRSHGRYRPIRAAACSIRTKNTWASGANPE